MSDLSVDIAIIGAGFGGSLMSAVLAQSGFSVALIDKSAHPRFAIGESSTPIANLVLGDLARKYDLPQLLPLTKYGTWQESHPELVCGIKRGFSYFKHKPFQEFVPTTSHGNELMVAASSSDQVADTHWLRADVDTCFVEVAKEVGATYFDSTDVDLEQTNQGWTLIGTRDSENVRIDAAFLIDASGAAEVLPRFLKLDSDLDRVRTKSRAVYAHFADVAPFDEFLKQTDSGAVEHPFCCDHAAQHHILDQSWMWMLRFNNGITSAGLVINELLSAGSAQDEWNLATLLCPSVGRLFENAKIVDPQHGLVGTQRLQRRVRQIAGSTWALLPNTAGFIDPLHSTGIAHTLCGIERLASVVSEHWKQQTLTHELSRYETAVGEELSLIDDLVYGCFQTFRHFRLFVAYSMLYFTAATTYERRRLEKGEDSNCAFLCADDVNFRNLVVGVTLHELEWLLPDEPFSEYDVQKFEDYVAMRIEPYNTAGLCDRSVNNMYCYTTLPDSAS